MQKLDFIQNATGKEPKAILNTVKLLEEGATIPFISRYRKEMTGALDEVEVGAIRDFAKKYDDLISRQQTILSSIEEQGKLTDQLKEKVLGCFDSNTRGLIALTRSAAKTHYGTAR